MQLVNVSGKLQVGVSHDLEMIHSQFHYDVGVFCVFQASVLSLEFCEGQGCLTSIAYLASIPACLVIFGIVLRCKACNQLPVYLYYTTFGFEAILYHVHVQYKHFDGFFLVEFGIVKTDVNA